MVSTTVLFGDSQRLFDKIFLLVTEEGFRGFFNEIWVSLAGWAFLSVLLTLKVVYTCNYNYSAGAATALRGNLGDFGAAAASVLAFLVPAPGSVYSLCCCLFGIKMLQGCTLWKNLVFAIFFPLPCDLFLGHPCDLLPAHLVSF